jgi:heme iron utilization protein
MSDNANKDLIAARRLYAQSQQGVLSTISKSMDGFPFGSVITFAPDASAAPLILISDLAEHTRNLKADPRVSLIVLEGGADVQEAGRLTVVGEARVVSDTDAVAARYYRRFPHASGYHQAHDFAFYRIQPVRIRYIGGFGRIHWYSPEQVLLPNPFAGSAEDGMIRHMNEDHVEAMRDYCRLAGVECADEAPRMSGVDANGFELFIGKRMLRFDFETPAATPIEVRQALVALAKRAREAAAA